MNYLITERQIKILKEHISDPKLWVKRRANYETMKTFINQSINITNPCDSNYKNEYEFSYDTISLAIDDFISMDEDIFSMPDKELYEIESKLQNLCEKWFSNELLNLYREKCK